jgi:hypothetical protein
MSNLILLQCGHNGHAIHKNVHDGLPANHPSCVICTPDIRACLPEQTINLEGRLAECMCGNKEPSSTNLAFFEFRGVGSRSAVETCECGYYEVAHPNRYCEQFKPRGPYEFDTFYCGCRGWD